MAGRPPLYFPAFTPADVETCRQLVRRRHAPHVEVQRARLALLLHDRPDLSSRALARELGLSEEAVRKWRKRWCQGPFALEDQPRSAQG